MKKTYPTGSQNSITFYLVRDNSMNRPAEGYMKLLDKLLSIPFVQKAIEEQADLRAFKKKPTPRIIFGITAICFSFVIGWPAVAALGTLSIYLGKPVIAAVGGPLVYGMSHLVFMLGMYLAGAEYSLIFFRWATRIAVEKLIKKRQKRPNGS
jgi:hypothetical protein